MRLALSERSERIYASRVSECEHMQIGFFERSEKMPGSKFAPISNTRSKRACYKIKVQKSLIFDLPYVFLMKKRNKDSVRVCTCARFLSFLNSFFYLFRGASKLDFMGICDTIKRTNSEIKRTNSEN
ncbi:hypothetical protein [Campylobacter devanensis]|uniref:hypothetical protein n=1 Tax=Campylobacter devanensis TaxID=3161138 RepID=UPI00112F9C10|nr:hypothetical protein [Campylobacter sp. P090]